jgi:hypothetical protein
MPPMQQHEDRQTAVDRLVSQAEATARVASKTHELTLSADLNDPTIRVRDLRTGALVAFSSTRADFDQSLAEFIFDYIV